MPMLQTLKNELDQLMTKNREDGTFGKMQDEMVSKLCGEEPEFMVDVLQIYSYDMTERLTKIDDLYMNPQMNIRALKSLVRQIKESSLSVGCEKVTLACTEFMKAIEQQSSVDGCERALTHIKREFGRIKAELKEIIELNRDIRILSTPPQD
ncbi:hypothetical protein C5167_026738 [Papaver somniferum]|uniref:uncharacterized protein LOC113326644 n=1 Tax=Papaver somniferum TaxID=3469 RepID=UPI000E6F4F52|nr:uncharacterized protein LOC113326644 [Papaver somniferum]RZC86062.1 hypothetical protein C5167_026738 [Papaver somniferum]